MAVFQHAAFARNVRYIQMRHQTTWECKSYSKKEKKERNGTRAHNNGDIYIFEALEKGPRSSLHIAALNLHRTSELVPEKAIPARNPRTIVTGNHSFLLSLLSIPGTHAFSIENPSFRAAWPHKHVRFFQDPSTILTSSHVYITVRKRRLVLREGATCQH